MILLSEEDGRKSYIDTFNQASGFKPGLYAPMFTGAQHLWSNSENIIWGGGDDGGESQFQILLCFLISFPAAHSDAELHSVLINSFLTPEGLEFPFSSISQRT